MAEVQVHVVRLLETKALQGCASKYSGWQSLK